MIFDPDTTEADTRANLITPVLLERGWDAGLIFREQKTEREIEIDESGAGRRGRRRVDYVMLAKFPAGAEPLPVALIEAKKSTAHPGAGLEQAKSYAENARFNNVRFVYSSNGHQFVELDLARGKTSAPMPMAEFPTPADLLARYQRAAGVWLQSDSAKPLLTEYKTGDSKPRYYQDAAIRAVLEKLARDESASKPPRALLSLATGAGKTFVAVNTLGKIARAGRLRRALFLCDRNELREQARAAFRRVFGNAAVAAKESGGRNEAANARIHIATYQTLGLDEAGDAAFLNRHYGERDYFSHIVIDECHRSGFRKWREILDRNANAAQIGLTATPRQIQVSKSARHSESAKKDERRLADNFEYFGEPVFEYGMERGRKDGYLAACNLIPLQINLDASGVSGAEIARRRPVDAVTGRPADESEIKDEYGAKEFEEKLELPDRVKEVCRHFFGELLAAGDPKQKTIIFCVSDSHAQRVCAEMQNLYSGWLEGRRGASHYAFQCTAQTEGNRMIGGFRELLDDYYVATTVDLLSTGVDIPRLRNIVIFRYLRSPILFAQMLGRGARVHEDSGKLSFSVFDYTGAADLLGAEFVSRAPSETEKKGEKEIESISAIRVAGFEVKIDEGERKVMVAGESGRGDWIPLAEYRAEMAAAVKARAPTAADLRALWVSQPEREEFLGALAKKRFLPEALRRLENKPNCDDFDVLAELCGWLSRALTRAERLERFFRANDDWIGGFGEETRGVLRAIARVFGRRGVGEIDSRQMYNAAEVRAAGGRSAIEKGGNPGELLREIKKRLFAE